MSQANIVEFVKAVCPSVYYALCWNEYSEEKLLKRNFTINSRKQVFNRNGTLFAGTIRDAYKKAHEYEIQHGVSLGLSYIKHEPTEIYVCDREEEIDKTINVVDEQYSVLFYSPKATMTSTQIGDMR